MEGNEFRIGKAGFHDMQHLVQALELTQRQFPELWIKALNDVGDIAHKYFGRQFASEGGEFGEKWAALKQRTQEDRKRRGYKPAHPILVRRGYLRASLTSKTSAYAQRTVTIRGIEMKSTLTTKTGNYNLFEKHQSGAGRIPARKMSAEGDPPFLSKSGWKEIQTRFLGMFFELRLAMERK